MKPVRWLPLLLLCVLGACSRARISAPASSAPASDSYVDLQAGSTLRIVIPLLKSGGFQAQLIPKENGGSGLSFSAADLLGITTSYYALVGKGTDVGLRFISAEESRDGKSTPLKAAPPLPFELPRHTQHIRLVYLVRSSQADHNMAIAASRQLDALNAFSNRLQQDPSLCRSDDEIFCTWVPAGIAVRPESEPQ